MKQRIKIFLAVWAAILLVMAVAHPIWMAVEPQYTWGDLADVPAVVWYGLAMDLSMSAYIVSPVLLLIVASIWVVRPWMAKALRIYLWVEASLIAVGYVLDAVLYPYWGFRLDVTPWFYFVTSPSSAMASLPWYAEVGVVALMAVLALAIGLWMRIVVRRFGLPTQPCSPLRRRIWMTVVWLMVCGVMIIPIRGGITVSTMSPARAFFSEDMRLNHAAINPLFSFLYSFSHTDDLGSQFRYMDTKEASAEVDALFHRPAVHTDSVAPAYGLSLKVARPDVYIVILESFSAELMPSLGGRAVAVNLDSIARTGALWTRFYAESFRTDRALTTILGGYPAQPSTSLLRYINKFDKIPTLSTVLAANGYRTAYYYGGDINFTNLRAYLRATSYARLVCDKSFPVGERLSKWGVHDGPVFDRALSDIAARTGSTPTLTVIQTSSSHEPFEVPFGRFPQDKRLNAFSYADACLGRFVRRLRDSGAWERALVVIVPDHWGAWPQGLEDRMRRHHVPLVMTGGALAGTPVTVDKIGSQSGIATTILRLMGIRDALPFGRDLLDTGTAGFGYVSEPSWFGLVTERGLSVVSTDTGATLQGDSADVHAAKALVQSIYTDLSKR